MDYQVKINARFNINVAKIYAYLRYEWGFTVADEFYAAIKARLDLLERYPFVGAPSKQRIDIRSITAGKHNRIYYKVQNNVITILTILDNRIDPNKNPYK